MKYLIPFFTFLALSTSCIVSKKKYDELARLKSQLELEKADCGNQLKADSLEMTNLNNQIKNLKTIISSMSKDSADKVSQIGKLKRDISGLNESGQKLSKNYDKLQSTSSSEIAKRENDLAELEKKNKVLQLDLQERETRVKELEKIIADKEKATQDLKDRVSKALLNFKDKDLTVKVKNGKVYVSLAEQLLFKSGSTQVDPKGAEALKKLSDALKNEKEISVMVEGHTDDVPMAKGTPGIEDNWDLSVLRATSITRILIGTGLSPKQVTPSGHGQFQPVAEGKSSEARQKNRRTEIILTPKLDDLFKILEN